MNSMSAVQTVPSNAFPGLFQAEFPARHTRRIGDMQKALVPAIAYRDHQVEAHGQAIPMDEVGGDLADLVATGSEVTAYVADASGHGLRAGVLMGMLKTAMRYGLHLGQSLPKLLDHINLVLPSVKEPSMYATLSVLRFDGTHEVEYLSAGHVPLLHYRRRTGDVVRYSMDQFPLGLFQGFGYVSRRLRYEPGDIFALVTDGIVETGMERDAEFGFDRLAQILREMGGCPLAEISAAVQDAVAGYGAQEDDQTVMLVRALGNGPAFCN
jgi:sigma-B regulation protein RsbU (phosphoserine phosphatase)